MPDYLPIPSRKNFQDLTGQKYGRLTVLGYLGRKNGQSHWAVKCDCGKVHATGGWNMRKGHIVSCGCYLSDRVQPNTKHGEFCGKRSTSSSKEYNIWRGIRSRCNNPNTRYWKWYGGRGVRVCKEWEESFEAFLAAVGRCPGPKYSLDRRDNNGNYEPGNVHWVLPKQQGRNRRDNHIVTYRGRDMPLVEACELAGRRYGTVVARLKAGRSITEALDVPIRHWRRVEQSP